MRFLRSPLCLKLSVSCVDAIEKRGEFLRMRIYKTMCRFEQDVYKNLFLTVFLRKM
jgi:hypothetical protein